MVNNTPKSGHFRVLKDLKSSDLDPKSGDLDPEIDDFGPQTS